MGSAHPAYSKPNSDTAVGEDKCSAPGVVTQQVKPRLGMSASHSGVPGIVYHLLWPDLAITVAIWENQTVHGNSPSFTLLLSM